MFSAVDGQPGQAGPVTVKHLNELRKGMILKIEVGAGGKGGNGGDPAPSFDVNSPELGKVHRGGIGGGRENLPIIEAFRDYASKFAGAKHEGLCFLEPGTYEVDWPYNTPTATLVIIGAGGGGGGAMGGDILPGEDGLPGATFLFPTYIPLHRPSD